jgi:hypothetical protein
MASRKAKKAKRTDEKAKAEKTASKTVSKTASKTVSKTVSKTATGAAPTPSPSALAKAPKPPSEEQAALAEANSLSARMAGEAALLVVDSQESALQAGRMLVQLKQATKQVEEKRKYLVAPLKEHIKRIEALFRPTLDRLAEADQQLRRKLLDWEERVRAEAEAERARLLAEAQEAQAEGEAEVAIEKASEAASLTVEKTKLLDEGSIQTKQVWTFEVEDLGKVPPEYFSLDETKVRAAIRAGVREIPGLRIFQKLQLAVSGGVGVGGVGGVDAVAEA